MLGVCGHVLLSVERFLGSQGRQKNTLAVYRALMEGKDPAFQEFVSWPTINACRTSESVENPAP